METGDVPVSIRMGPSWRVQKPGVLFSDSKLLAPVEICMTIQELWNCSMMFVKNGCKLPSLGDRLKTLFWRFKCIMKGAPVQKVEAGCGAPFTFVPDQTSL